MTNITKRLRKIGLPVLGLLTLMLPACAPYGYNNGFNNGWGRNAVFVNNNGWAYGHRNNVFVENNNWRGGNMAYYHPGRRW